MPTCPRCRSPYDEAGAATVPLPTSPYHQIVGELVVRGKLIIRITHRYSLLHTFFVRWYGESREIRWHTTEQDALTRFSRATSAYLRGDREAFLRELHPNVIDLRPRLEDRPEQASSEAYTSLCSCT
jgi:hypothetical protein